MPFTLPDKGEGDSDIQSIFFQEYLDTLVAGISGLDCVLSGLAVTSNSNMVPSVAKGGVLSNGVMFAVAGTTVTVTTADATNPRIDLIVVDSSGALQVRAGTAAATPKPPARTAHDVVISAVYVPAADTNLATSQFTDMRVVRDRDITVKKTSTAVTNNTTSAIQTYFTVTLPSGLFLSGKQLHVKCGGNYLLNSGVPTATLTIAYGGTTMFADPSTAAVAGTNRGAWDLDFILNASGNATQTLVGMLSMSDTNGNTSKVAATTGIGDLADVPTAYTNDPINTPIRGTAAVDSDAGDRTLTVQWTMSVSNALDEWVLDSGNARLI